jgi:hypothetical protein
MIFGDDPNNIVPNPLAMAQANNLYAYTVNNPLRYIDPTGFNCEDDDNSFDLLREIWDDFRPTFDGFWDGLSSVLDLSEWGVLGGLLLRGYSIDRAIENLPAGQQILLSNLIVAREVANLTGVENIFGKVPWIFLGVDVVSGGIQDWQNGESRTRIGSNAAARTGVASTAIVGGGFLGSVLAGGKKGGTVGLIGGPKGSLGGAILGGLIGGGAYVAANFTGVTDWVSDQIYSGVRNVQNAWDNRPRWLFNW